MDPTTGRAPPGRNSFAVSGKSLKRAWLSSVWDRKVASTVNPSRASSSAGLSSWRSGRLPQASSALVQVAGGAGDADGAAAGLALLEGDGDAVLLEQGGGGRGRGGLAPVDGVHPAGLGVVVDEVAAPADARRVGLGDPEGRGGGDGRVHGVAAGAQDGDAHGRGVGVDAGDGPAVPGGDGHLGRRGGGGGRGGGPGGDERSREGDER
ncbi:hypothetical protein GCM10020254_21410 [Streptomyces goshikiensis]